MIVIVLKCLWTPHNSISLFSQGLQAVANVVTHRLTTIVSCREDVVFLG